MPGKFGGQVEAVGGPRARPLCIVAQGPPEIKKRWGRTSAHIAPEYARSNEGLPVQIATHHIVDRDGVVHPHYNDTAFFLCGRIARISQR